MRVNLNEGQEVIRQDLNKLQIAKEREFYDRVIYELLKRKTDGFFQGSCLVTRVNATTIQVAAGFGFQNDVSQVSPESTKRPIYLTANTNKTLTAADPALNRIDIVSIKAARGTTLTESRRYKATINSVVTDEVLDVETDWQADIVVTAGQPHGSPSVPATPAGYIKIAEILITAAVGLNAAGDITDKRTILPVASSSSLTGGWEYDAIVGDTNNPDIAYATLAAALAASSAGWRILVTRSETINTTPEVALDNIEIDFKRGVTFTKGSATKGLLITGDGCRINNGRFSGFSGGGEIGIHVNGGEYCNINGSRFYNCTTNVQDDSVNGLNEVGTFTEV